MPMRVEQLTSTTTVKLSAVYIITVFSYQFLP